MASIPYVVPRQIVPNQYGQTPDTLATPFCATGLPHPDGGLLRCDVCAKEFREQKYLTRHMTVHSGYKPFQCQYCDYKCNRKDNLKTHVFIRHVQK